MLNNSVCADAYGRRYSIPIRDYHLCAGALEEGEERINQKGGKGTCVVSPIFEENYDIFPLILI